MAKSTDQGLQVSRTVSFKGFKLRLCNRTALVEERMSKVIQQRVTWKSKNSFKQTRNNHKYIHALSHIMSKTTATCLRLIVLKTMRFVHNENFPVDRTERRLIDRYQFVRRQQNVKLDVNVLLHAKCFVAAANGAFFEWKLMFSAIQQWQLLKNKLENLLTTIATYNHQKSWDFQMRVLNIDSGYSCVIGQDISLL